ncbi:hypothetical protein [Prosthecobacter sp.]
MRLFFFVIGATLALAWSALSIWLGSKNNNQGEYFDALTGEWDVSYVLIQFAYPLTIWLVIFWVFGGFRKQVNKEGEKQ